MTPRVRRATPDDVEEIRSIYAPVVRETHVSFEETPPSVESLREEIDDDRYPWLVYADERVLGFAKATPHKSRAAYRWAVDVSAYVRDGHRGRGIGARLYETLLAVLAEQGFYTAVAVVALPNPASVGLHESTGFERVGSFNAVGYKRGEWRDVGWWQRSLGERPPDPDPPRPVDAVAGTDSELRAIARGGATSDDRI